MRGPPREAFRQWFAFARSEVPDRRKKKPLPEGVSNGSGVSRRRGLTGQLPGIRSCSDSNGFHGPQGRGYTPPELDAFAHAPHSSLIEASVAVAALDWKTRALKCQSAFGASVWR